MGKKTKIDWADATWNPVTGCLHGCEYCYARRIAERFRPEYVSGMYGTNESEVSSRTNYELKEPMRRCRYESDGVKLLYEKTAYPFGFVPTFHRYRLEEPQRWKKPRNIFVCSMADLFGAWVPDEWIRQVFEACDAAPQHRFLFITKNPSRYKELENLLPLHRRPPAVAEMWFGHSYTGTGDYKPMQLHLAHSRFVSIEPLLHDLSEQDMMIVAATNDWIIIGAETGHRKGKVIPKKSWVDGIVYYAKRNNVPVFMKESLREIMGDDFRQDFPWEV